MNTATINYDSYLPEGIKLFDYQHVGVAYALVATADGKGTYIADEQGLGKTWQAIVAAKVRNCRKILIVVKSSLKVNWQREVNRLAPEWTVQIAGGTRPYETYANVVIINYDLLSTWADALIADGYDCLILDESHYVKSLGTPRKPVQRTAAAIKISADIRRRQGMVLLLTGTPLLNRPVELVTQLQIMGRLEEIAPRPRKGQTLRDYEFSFKFTFCGPENPTGHGWEFKGSSNLDLLNARLRGSCFVRRLRNDVLNMDDTHRVEVVLSLNGALAQYNHVAETFKAKHSNSYYIELLNALRKEAGAAKIESAVDWIKDFREDNPGKKLIVWAWHVPVQSGIARALNAAGIKAVYLREDQEKGRLMKSVDAFNDGDVEVLVCSLKAHAEGFTLTGDGHNITDSLFVEQPWHPGSVSQAEDRINRPGRKADAVFAHTLVATDTVDEWLAHLISEKWSTFKSAINGTITADEEDDIKAQLMALLMAKYPNRQGNKDWAA